MRRLCLSVPILVQACCLAWIDYDDSVERKEPAFGKVFNGFSLRLSTDHAEFEQDSGEQVRVTLRNDTDATSLAASADQRTHVLNIVFATEDGTTYVSRNLLEHHPDNPISTGRIPPRAGIDIMTLDFDALRVASFKDYAHGMPRVEPNTRRVSAGSLVPRIYILRAILFSSQDGERPDFAVASDSWPILLKPKSGDRMSAAERRTKMQSWLDRMSTGAYGGIGVSSQLAALGDQAVGPLIQMAEKRGRDERGTAADQTIRESRIWAIITLCNTGSKAAEDYILRRLWNPVGFGDLSFITWHSQGFGSDRVTEELRRFAEDAANGRPMPWEKTHGPESRRHARGALEFLFKHFIHIDASITDGTMRGLVALGDPKLLAFGLMAWQPDTAEKAIQTVLPVFTGGRVHGNVKKAVLGCLSKAAHDHGFPPYSREDDLGGQWLKACLWLRRAGQLDDSALQAALRRLVFDIPRDREHVQAAVIAALSKSGAHDYPVDTVRPVLPGDWVATWQWALQTGDLPREEAIAFCTGMMRTRNELPDEVKRGLLVELKRLIGSDFPLTSTPPEDLDQDWPTCGRWLVEHGYFGEKGQ